MCMCFFFESPCGDKSFSFLQPTKNTHQDLWSTSSRLSFRFHYEINLIPFHNWSFRNSIRRYKSKQQTTDQLKSSLQSIQCNFDCYTKLDDKKKHFRLNKHAQVLHGLSLQRLPFWRMIIIRLWAGSNEADLPINIHSAFHSFELSVRPAVHYILLRCRRSRSIQTLQKKCK